jgi:hypothetical protein
MVLNLLRRQLPASLIASLMRVIPGWRSRWRPALLLAVLMVDALLVLAHLCAPTVESTIGPADVVAREGHAYLFQMHPIGPGWLYGVASDGPAEARSELQVTLAGTALGPAHAAHERIRKVGNGAYSHWRGTLYLSMPGNRELEPITLRAASKLSAAAIDLASILTLLVLGVCAATWYPRLFTTPLAQAHAYRRVGLALALGMLVIFLASWATTPPLVTFETDTAGYLRPALVAFQGGELETQHRTLGYPAFLTAMLVLAGSLVHVPTAQIVLLAATVLALVALLSMASRPRAGDGLGLSFLQTLITVTAVAALLAYQPLTSYVHQIMPEALYAFLAVLNLLILIAAYRQRSAVGLIGLYLVGTLLGTYTYYVKPHWGAALAFTWIALTARLFLRLNDGQRLRLPLAIAAPVLAAAAALALLVLPQRALHERYGGASHALFAPLTLFCTNANLVVSALQHVEAPPDLKARLTKSLRETLEGGPGRFYQTLGFDPDYCFYRSSIRSDLSAHFGDDVRSQRDLLMRSYFAAVRQQPAAYASKVVRQVAYAVSHPFPFASYRGRSSPEAYRAIAESKRMAQLKLPEAWVTGIAPRPLLAALPSIERIATAVLGFVDRYAIWIWAVILAGAGVATARWRRGSEACGRALLTTGLAAGLYLSSTIVVALAHSFDVARYLEALAPLALVAMAVSLLQLSSAVLGGKPGRIGAIGWAPDAADERPRVGHPTPGPAVSRRRRWLTAASIALLTRTILSLRRRWRPAALLAVLVVDALLALAHLRAPAFESTIGPADVLVRQGHAYVFRIGWPEAGWLYELASDGEDGNRSQLQVTHAGLTLGPAHAAHAHIRKVGNGAYSHWKGVLYLSMPDNRELAQPVTLRAVGQLSTSIVSVAALLTGLALLAFCTTWYRQLFANPLAQAHAYRRIAAGLALGLLVVFVVAWMTAAPLVIFGADTAGYLLPALAAIQGGDLQTVYRTLGYPAFLTAVLFLTGSLAHVPAAQVALLSGTVLATVALLWMASRPRAGDGLGLAFVRAAAMLATVAALLAYQPLMNNAHRLMTESLYTFLAVLNLLVLVAAYRQRSAASLIGLYLFGTLLATYNYYVKPHWGAALAFTWVLLTVRLFLRVGAGPKLRLPLAVAAPVVAAAVALVLLVLPQRDLHERYGPRYALFGPFTLFCVHANLVEPVIRQSDHPPELKARLLQSLRETLEGDRGTFEMLGFDPDYCFYRSKLQADLNAHFGRDIRAQRDLLMRSFFAAVLQDPLGYVSKVARQIAYALSHPFSSIADRDGYRRDIYLELAKHTRMVQHRLPEAWTTGIEPRPLLAALPLVELLATQLLAALDWAAVAIWAAILAGACVMALRWRRASAPCGRALVTMGLAAGLYLCSIVVVALAHSFDIDRYLTALGPLALASMAVCILELSHAWVDHAQAAGANAELRAGPRALPTVPKGLAPAARWSQ